MLLGLFTFPIPLDGVRGFVSAVGEAGKAVPRRDSLRFFSHLAFVFKRMYALWEVLSLL